MENKTAVYNRKVYEIGSPYLFSEHGKEWIYGILTDVDCNYKNPFCTDAQDWSSIKEIPSGANGTITPAPVEMINGNAYLFDINDSTYIGFYNKFQKAFFHSMFKGVATGAALEDCTYIREMTVKETK